MPPPISLKLDQLKTLLGSNPTSNVIHVWFEGDSISSPFIPRYEQGVVNKWNIPWTGWVTQGSEPFQAFLNNSNGFRTVTSREYNWYAGTTVAPGTQNEYEWSGDEGNGSGILRLTSLASYQNKWLAGDWTNNVPLKFKWNFWGTPTTITKLRVRGRRNTDSGNDDQRNVDVSANPAALKSVVCTIPVAINSGSNYPDPDILCEDGYNETGLKLIPLPGVLYRVDGSGNRLPGFHFSCQASHGGFDALLHVDQTKCSDAQRSIHYGMLAQSGDIVLFVIQLGVNNPSSRTAAQYASDVLAMVENRRVICNSLGLSCYFLIISPYDVNSPSFQSALDQELYDMVVTQSDCSFYSLYQTAGPYSTINPLYLSDGVHPNASGVDYFMNLVWQAIAGTTSTSNKQPVVPIDSVGLM